MTRVELEQWLRERSTEFERVSDQSWRIVAHDAAMQIFSNEAKDRMRVVAHVAAESELVEEQLRAALRAGFQLDARYALHDEELSAVFTHALSDLSATTLESALRQVGELVRTFGTTYSSGSMRFEPDRRAALAAGTGMRRRTEESVEAQNERSRRRR